MKLFSKINFSNARLSHFMRSRTFLIIVTNVLSFMAGYFLFNWKIQKYHVDEYTIVYHEDLPLYGLPLTEFSILLRAVSEGDSQKTKKLLIGFLNTTIKDAMKRSATAPERNKNEIRRTLLRAEELFYKYRDIEHGASPSK